MHTNTYRTIPQERNHNSHRYAHKHICRAKSPVHTEQISQKGIRKNFELSSVERAELQRVKKKTTEELHIFRNLFRAGAAKLKHTHTHNRGKKNAHQKPVIWFFFLLAVRSILHVPCFMYTFPSCLTSLFSLCYFHIISSVFVYNFLYRFCDTHTHIYFFGFFRIRFLEILVFLLISVENGKEPRTDN